MWFTLAGLAVGFAVGATGVGGGALMTPILLAMGIPSIVAVGTDLLYAAITKGFGVVFHNKSGTVNWRIVMLLAAGSLPTTGIILWILHDQGLAAISDGFIKITLGIAVTATAILTLFKNKVIAAVKSSSNDWLRELHKHLQVPVTVIGGAAIGALVTLSSVGAGVIGAVLLMVVYPSMKPARIVGTDLAHAVPLTALAGLGHAQLGTTDWELLGLLLLGSIPGIYLGTKVGLRLPDEVLRPIIAVVLLIIGIGLIVSTAIQSSIH